ncbi:MAG TPA: hypothetical protein VEA38_08280 [Terriglobales bacterium]|nr:hypothetical protein [Terriglobales bacterium]
MKNRAQSFECSIAGKTVRVSLRHGGGLQEPAGVYVRCDERDCQYVDLNATPCPLTPELFADGSDRRVTDHLTQRAGERFCYACLTELLDVTHDQVRRASWRLKEATGFAIKPARCVLCHRRRVTIGVTRDGALEIRAAVPVNGRPADGTSPAAPLPAPAPSLDAPLPRYLDRHPGFAFCAHCLARELGGSPAAMREAMWMLEPLPQYQVRTAQCVSCLLTKRVIRNQAATGEADAPRRVIELLLKNPGAPFCTSCVAFTTDMALPDARRIVGYLEGLDDFRRETTACSACGRWQPTVAAVSAEADLARVTALADVAVGRVRHRGMRVDLLSFRTAEGWRPFALVKSPAGALVPDAPALVFDAAASKAEADEIAARYACEWIDKRWP